MKIAIADDDKLVCSSLKTIVESSGDIKVAGICHGGREAIGLYRALKPDILLMDIRMDGMSGLDSGEQLLKLFPEARILFLTTFADDEYIVRALRMGSRGYMLKQDFESIVPALRAVANGQCVFGDDIVSRIPTLLQESRKPDFLSFGVTERETEIIGLVAEGMSNKEIAATLFLSEGTLRNYLSVVLEKLALRDRTQLAVFFYKNR